MHPKNKIHNIYLKAATKIIVIRHFFHLVSRLLSKLLLR